MPQLEDIPALRRLTGDERDALGASLPGWSLDVTGKAIVRSLRFSDFNEAMGFMCRVGMLAEKADHHPEWSNVYDRVDIRLTTHDVDGLSSRDVELARAIDALVART